MAEISGVAARATRLLVRYGNSGTGVPSCRATHSARNRSLVVHPVRLDVHHNSGYASDRANGAQWGGRGLSSALRVGATARWRGVTLRLAPEVLFHANRAYRTRPPQQATLHEYADPFYAGRIDLPRRFGDDGRWRVSAGQSSLMVGGRWVEGGLSTENLWSGPANRYPILLSDVGAGFPHLFLGTRQAPDVWIGRLNARLFWGRIAESDFFDDDPTNDWSNLVGWGLSLWPRGMDWLEVGALRLYHYRADSSLDLDPGPVIGFLTPRNENRLGDEIASIFMRATLPASDAEFYAEWARTDRFQDLTGDFIPEPDHSQGYMVGFQKLSPVAGGTIRVLAELIHLQEKSEDRIPGAGRPLNVFYTNGEVRQGHTHLGQLLGAWVGPGADAQFVGIDYIGPDAGMLGLFAERVRRNEAARIAIRARDADPSVHDVEMIGGVRGHVVLRGLSISGSIAAHRRWNRDFLANDGNVQATLELAWLPDGWGR